MYKSLAVVAAATLLTACGATLDYRNAEVSNGMVYAEGANEPFNGLLTNAPVSLLQLPKLGSASVFFEKGSGDKSLSEFGMASALGAIGVGGNLALCDIEIRDGVPDGSATCVDAKARLPFLDLSYVGGTPNGEFRTYAYGKGVLVSEGSVVDSQIDGTLRVFAPSGDVTYEGEWINGRREGIQEVLSPTSGKIRLRFEAKDGLAQGAYVEYSEDGSRVIHCANFRDGKLDGVQEFYAQARDTMDVTYWTYGVQVMEYSAEVPGPRRCVPGSEEQLVDAPVSEEVSSNSGSNVSGSGSAVVEQTIQATASALVGEEYSDARLSSAGDLNSDGNSDEAVVFTIEVPSSNSAMQHLAAFVRQDDDTLRFAGSTVVGGTGGTSVGRLSVDQGQMVLTTLTHGPNDPDCCPSVEENTRFELSGGALRQVQ